MGAAVRALSKWHLRCNAGVDTVIHTIRKDTSISGVGCRLPAEVHEHFFAHVEDQMSTWFPIRRRTVQKFLAGLKVDKATGPDGLSAIFLQRLAKVLSLPLAIIIRRIFNESTWPAKWRLHHIVPLFKRGSAFLPGQYQGVHLTSILSKVVERVIGNPLTAFLEASWLR